MATFYTNPKRFTKHTAETFNITFDFTNYLPSGETLSSVSVQAVNQATGKVDSDVHATFAVQAGNLTAKGLVQNGEIDTTYLIRCEGTTTASEIYVLVTEMYVTNELKT